jgi:hypothetical protein
LRRNRRCHNRLSGELGSDQQINADGSGESSLRYRPLDSPNFLWQLFS